MIRALGERKALDAPIPSNSEDLRVGARWREAKRGGAEVAERSAEFFPACDKIATNLEVLRLRHCCQMG